MTPNRYAALEWCRDDGNHFNIPGQTQPTRFMLYRLQTEGLVTLSDRRDHKTSCTLTDEGRAQLEAARKDQTRRRTLKPRQPTLKPPMEIKKR